MMYRLIIRRCDFQRRLPLKVFAAGCGDGENAAMVVAMAAILFIKTARRKVVLPRMCLSAILVLLPASMWF